MRGRGWEVATPQSSKWYCYKRESQPEKGKRVRDGAFPILRLSVNAPGKSSLDIIVQKGIKTNFPICTEDWVRWCNGKEKIKLRFWGLKLCEYPLFTRLTPNLPHPGAAYAMGWSMKIGIEPNWRRALDSRYPGVLISIWVTPISYQLFKRESRSSLTTLLALSF